MACSALGVLDKGKTNPGLRMHVRQLKYLSQNLRQPGDSLQRRMGGGIMAKHRLRAYFQSYWFQHTNHVWHRHTSHTWPTGAHSCMSDTYEDEVTAAEGCHDAEVLPLLAPHVQQLQPTTRQMTRLLLLLLFHTLHLGFCATVYPVCPCFFCFWYTHTYKHTDIGILNWRLPRACSTNTCN